MALQFEKFSAYPRAVKLAIACLVAGWAGHFLFIRSYFPGLSLSTIYKQVGIGFLICLFVALINRWARMMCIFFNIVLIAYYLWFCSFFFNSQSNYYQHGGYLLFAAACLGSFVAATYFLLTRECNQFFKAYGRTPKDEA